MYCVLYMLFSSFFLEIHTYTHIPQTISMVTTSEGDDLGAEVVVTVVQKGYEGNASIFF